MTDSSFSRREFLTASAAALGAGLAPRISYAEKSKKKPEKLNILIFMPDQLRAESIGCYGQGQFYDLRKQGSRNSSIQWIPAFAGMTECAMFC